ncbi:hypothetical protein CIPAW_01G275000 [Carya illinoinensis]|uniref:Uncharacterized protein n=1 Tax=Carya illinoinensis TaxID=32201 RepID=A0A8T1RR24_CARIL|nr:hypothetical protein CIPAW_01G275000 [Carya illinoinensis]
MQSKSASFPICSYGLLHLDKAKPENIRDITKHVKEKECLVPVRKRRIFLNRSLYLFYCNNLQNKHEVYHIAICMVNMGSNPSTVCSLNYIITELSLYVVLGSVSRLFDFLPILLPFTRFAKLFSTHITAQNKPSHSRQVNLPYIYYTEETLWNWGFLSEHKCNVLVT